MKNACKYICILSGILFTILCAHLILSAVSALSQADASVGIIGGADLPTARLLLESVILKSPVFYGMIGVLLVFICSGFCLLRLRKCDIIQ